VPAFPMKAQKDETGLQPWTFVIEGLRHHYNFVNHTPIQTLLTLLGIDPE
jgi:hypothetical protein